MPNLQTDLIMDIPSELPQQKQSAWARARRSHVGVGAVVALTLFTDMLTYGCVLPCLPALVLERLHGNSSMVGFLFGVYAFGLLAATPVFAILSDKFQNRRLPMMAGCLGLMFSTLAFAQADTYALLVVARVAQGVAGGASWTIGLGMLADVFPTHRLGVVMGTVLTAHTVGFAIGPVMGGYLYEYYGFGAPFICCAFFAALNFLAVVWVAEPLHGQSHNEDDDSATTHGEETPLLNNKPNREPSETVTMWSLCKNWRVLSCLLCTIVSASVFSGIEPALPIHLRNKYDASASTVGLIFLGMVAPAFLAPLIGHLADKTSHNAISASGMIMMAFATPLLALHYPNIFLILPSIVLFGFSSPVTLTPVLPEMGQIVSEMGGEAYAQVYALYNIAYSAGMFIGPNCAGVLMTVASFETLMLVFSLCLILCSPVMMNWGTVWRWLVAHMPS